MDDRQRTRYEMGDRVDKFGDRHKNAQFPAVAVDPAQQPANTKARALFQSVKESVARTTALLLSQRTHEQQFHDGTSSEAIERDALMLDLKELNEAVASIVDADAVAARRNNTTSPTAGLIERFRMPWGLSDSELAAEGDRFANEAAAISARLIELGFPTNFATALRARVTAFRNAGGEQSAAINQQVGATAAFDPEIEFLLSEVNQLNTLCKKRFRSNAQLLGEWTAASHVERQSSGGAGGGAVGGSGSSGSGGSGSEPTGDGSGDIGGSGST